MSRQELKALADALPPDLLFSRQNVGKHLPGVTDLDAAIAYICEQGWWDRRQQYGVEEFWKDGQPHMRATITSAPPQATTHRCGPCYYKTHAACSRETKACPRASYGRLIRIIHPSPQPTPMNKLVKARFKADESTIVFPLFSGETVLGMIRELQENNMLVESDYDVLTEADITKEEWAQHIENELENMNWHSESEVIVAAFDYMDDKGAAGYAQHLIKTIS